MRLVLKRNDGTSNEFRFTNGPVYIGRHADSHVFLRDRGVSRHHAVIFATQDGKWMVEDLDSTNKTYLNGQVIHKSELKTGDSIRITDFTLDIYLEDGAEGGDLISLEDEAEVAKRAVSDDTLTRVTYSAEDTLTTAALEPQVIIRRLDSEHGPDMKMPAGRLQGFAHAAEAICKARGPDEVLQALLKIAAKQFNAYHAWCALRTQPDGPMICHAGRHRSGSAVELSEIKLNDKISHSVDRAQFLLFPRIPPRREKELIHSAMIAPVMGHAGCFGVLYLDNDLSHEHYSLGDLDYLMLIAIHTATVLENF